MKKWLCLFLILCVICSLSACGSTDSTELSSEAATESTPVAQEPVRLPVSSVPSDLFGSCSDELYTNALLKIQFSLPSDWYFYSTSRLAELSGIVSGENGVTQEQRVAGLRANGLTYDMLARESDGKELVAVSFVHMGYLYGKTMSEQEFAEFMLEDASNRRSGIDSAKANAVIETLYLARDEHPCLQFLSSENGVTLHKTMLFVQAGDFMAIVTACSPYRDNDASLIDDFFYFEPEISEDTSNEG